jgi:hypothetical protein
MKLCKPLKVLYGPCQRLARHPLIILLLLLVVVVEQPLEAAAALEDLEQQQDCQFQLALCLQ